MLHRSTPLAPSSYRAPDHYERAISIYVAPCLTADQLREISATDRVVLPSQTVMAVCVLNLARRAHHCSNSVTFP